jgi:histidinol phosphatase-like enzyme (inositol monophosphatase family)
MEQAFRDEFFLAGIQLAELASDISKKYFRQSLNIERKTDDNSPVTIADKKIEASLRAWIKDNYPDHGIIGEEYDSENKNAQYTWVIDPIDGTVAFACGKPTFTTLISLLENDLPQIGIIDQPILEDRFVGVVGQGSWLNGKKLVTSKVTELSNVRLNATTPYMFKSSLEQEKFALLRDRVKLTGFGGDAYSYGLLADGHIDVIMEADLHFYDVAALKPIIEASGGVITDWYGNKINQHTFNGQCLASANLKLHEAVLKVIA